MDAIGVLFGVLKLLLAVGAMIAIGSVGMLCSEALAARRALKREQEQAADALHFRLENPNDVARGEVHCRQFEIKTEHSAATENMLDMMNTFQAKIGAREAVELARRVYNRPPDVNVVKDCLACKAIRDQALSPTEAGAEAAWEAYCTGHVGYEDSEYDYDMSDPRW